MAAFKIINIHVLWDTTPSRQTSETSDVSVFMFQYVIPGRIIRLWRVLLDCVCLGKEARDHSISLYGIIIWRNLHFIEPEFSHYFSHVYISSAVSNIVAHSYCPSCHSNWHPLFFVFIHLLWKLACVFLSVSGILLTVPCSSTSSVLTSHHYRILLCSSHKLQRWSHYERCVILLVCAFHIWLWTRLQFRFAVWHGCFEGSLTCRQRNSVGFST